MTELIDARKATQFRFVDCEYTDGEACLSYAFDAGPLLIERIIFPDAPAVPAERQCAFQTALRLLHLMAGVSYYKAGVPKKISIEAYRLDAPTAALLDDVYTQGLSEFAYRNQLDIRKQINFSTLIETSAKESAAVLGMPRRTLVPLGGGKDSLVTVEALKTLQEPVTVVWIGNSPLIAACAAATDLPSLNIQRELSPLLFEYNRLGAWNGHIPVTAINSAILVVAAILYGYDAIAFSNEHSASSATLEHAGIVVNHQWSKGYAFERALHTYVKTQIAKDLDYFSVLRPWSELAVTRQFAQLEKYHKVFSSCNRNFRILGARPLDRWCGQCPKCHFVFLALAPFMAKQKLLTIFGRNLLDDDALASSFDALMEYREHKPFECVGEGRESRAAMYIISLRPEWREDALVARFVGEILPQLDRATLSIERLLTPHSEHLLPVRLQEIVDAFR